eukprot:1159325-Pelagomonas_calceolata.AAC.5
MPGGGRGQGRDQGASSSSSSRPVTSTTALASAAVRSSSFSTVPVAAPLPRAPASSSASMSRGGAFPPHAASSSMMHAWRPAARHDAAAGQGHDRDAGGGEGPVPGAHSGSAHPNSHFGRAHPHSHSGSAVLGGAGMGGSGGYALGGMPQGVKRGGVTGEALQVLDQLARTNPSLYAALSAIDDSPSTSEGNLSEDLKHGSPTPDARLCPLVLRYKQLALMSYLRSSKSICRHGCTHPRSARPPAIAVLNIPSSSFQKHPCLFRFR